MSQETNALSWLAWSKKWLNSLMATKNANAQTKAFAQYECKSIGEGQSTGAISKQGFLSRVFSFFTGGESRHSETLESKVVGGYFSNGSEISISKFQYRNLLTENGETEATSTEESEALKSKLFKDDEEEIEAEEVEQVPLSEDELSKLPTALQVNGSEIQLTGFTVSQNGDSDTELQVAKIIDQPVSTNLSMSSRIIG